MRRRALSEKDSFTTGEIARAIGVSQATVFRAIEKGALKASTTPGGHYRVRRECLQDYLRDHDLPQDLLGPKVARVLIVEDNPAELRLLQRALQDEPLLDIKATTSAYEAGFLTKSFRPDLLMLDVFLGDGDGRQILRLVRHDPELSRIKVLVVTASGEDAVLEELRRAGADDLLPKPFAPAELQARVRRLLR